MIMIDKFKNKLPETVIVGVAVLIMIYINISSHSKLPASAKNISAMTKTGFIQTALTETANGGAVASNLCHVVYNSNGQDVCYNAEPWFGYCWHPQQPGNC